MTIIKRLTAVFCLTSLVAGCGGNSSGSTPAPTPTETFKAGTHPRFDPVTSDIPFNTDLIFAAAAQSDGTANVGAATDPVRQVLNALDGFSISAPFDILLSDSINPATAIANQSVFLVALETGTKEPLDLANVTGVRGIAPIDVQVISLDGGSHNAIRIIPTKPLLPKTKYLVFLTNDLHDHQGKALTPSWTYNALRDNSFVVLDALKPVRTLVTAWEQLSAGVLASGSGGALSLPDAKKKLVLSYTFTTTDPETPLLAMAAPAVAIAGSLISNGVSPLTAVETATQLQALGILPEPASRPLALSAYTGVDLGVLSGGALLATVGKLYTGLIELPYYLTAPTTIEDTDYLKRNWQPDALIAEALGSELPDDVDGSYNMTWRFPFAAVTSTQAVPLQVTLPEADFVPGYAGVANCKQIFDATGYPVVIYIHGITSDRSSVLALAHTLASRCIATVAIDLPLHGIAANSALAGVLNVEHSAVIPFNVLYSNSGLHERHFNHGGQAGSPVPMNFENPGEFDGSGAHFINLGHLLNTRDNNRQAVVDLLNLNASMGALNNALKAFSVGINQDQLYVVGVSLGSILGSVFVTANEVALQQEQGLGLASALYPVRGFIASAGGSQLTQILTHSERFAPVIHDGLAAAGIQQGTTNYQRFIFAAQSALDSADSISFAGRLATLPIPVLLQQINDDGVIPNRVDHAPLAGTAGLVDTLKASLLGLGGAQPVNKHWVKLNAGGHTSLLRPEGGAPQVTAELQTQVATFVLSGGAVSVGAAAPSNIDTTP